MALKKSDLKYQRNLEIHRLREQEKLSIRQIAAQLNCSKSLVQHVLNKGELSLKSPSLLITCETSPQDIAKEINVIFGRRFSRKLADCLRTEVPLTLYEILERIRATTTPGERYAMAAMLAGDRYLVGQ